MTDPLPDQPGAQLRSRLALVAIALLFLAPIVAAVFLNSRWTDWQPEATRNYGELLDPVVGLPEALRQQLALDQRWTLIAAPGNCTGDCSALIDTLSRLDRALGRHAGEVREIVLVEGAPPAASGAGIALVSTDGRWAEFARRLPDDVGLLLVDPLGNAMMAYPRGFDAGRVRRDMDRLLRYSRFNAS